ncbi:MULTISPECIES: helix-hairpin-helix domain-containing protein [unclassified Streptomyces]|uniref:helix-hairpin-helix domain-containing protein n=1 Tax=unclassified Streptomyces TaxID=2593676 RepID=UPI002E293F60|nr:helix-hairpin-helix domain-containing protein [Streptomyces sp. NBC_00223]
MDAGDPHASGGRAGADPRADLDGDPARAASAENGTGTRTGDSHAAGAGEQTAQSASAGHEAESSADSTPSRLSGTGSGTEADSGRGAGPGTDPDVNAARAAGAGGLAQAAGGGGGGRRGGPGDVRAVEEARGVLAGGGAPGELAEAAVRLLGERAADALRADPWLVLGLDGVRPEQADAFARAVLGAQCGPGDERRGRALVAHLMERAAEQGHTALTTDALKAALTRHSVPDPDAAVAAAVEDGRVLVFRAEGDLPDVPEDSPEEAAVPLLLGLDRYALAEESLADGCVRLLRTLEDPSDWAGAAAPSPSAAELIRAAAGSGLVLHTGGEAARAEPAALVTAARAAGLRAYAAAYTENGRRRLAAAVGEDAALTVEGLLSADGGPGRAGDGSLALDLLAVLDAPQLSVEEAATLVEAVPDGARLVLSGDPYTMWSAGAGRAFADLLASGAFPRVTSRTPDPGPIGELVSCVGEGELTPVDAPGKEVVVVPVRDPREAVHRTVQLVADSVPRAFGVPPGQAQVITPAHGGPVGTRALNAALKERLNPGPGRFGGFDPGDRVVHVPAPGRTFPGVVVGAEAGGLRLECERGPVLVPREDVAATVRHGWAVTGHQAAGIRWPAVVVVVPGDAGPLLTRSWVYTAFSRGERHLSVVQGADQGLAAAVADPAAKGRTTRLSSVLRELAAES